MPPKGKAAVKSTQQQQPASSAQQSTTTTTTTTSTAGTSTQSTTTPTPVTVFERSKQRYEESLGPYELTLQNQQPNSGLSKLPPNEQLGWFYNLLARSHSARSRSHLGPKALKEVWKHVNEHSLPIRPSALARKQQQKPNISDWGVDKAGQEIGGYSLARFEERQEKQILLTTLEIGSRGFKENRDRAERGLLDPVTREKVVVTAREFEEEKSRRREMAKLRTELYGGVMGGKKNFGLDPEWDDVDPLPHEESDIALAAIAYPAEYAEAISYLRAVMLKKEYSARCLKLTEYIIEMNPAHYTVWLYRASILFAMKLSIPDEIEWLNRIALENLKNYQIWHHRHLLVDEYFPSIANSPEEISRFAESERIFLTTMLAEDSKNYHVWSYRSYLVGKLGIWGDEEELKSIEGMIEDDVRNNSAWSHRFFLVFSNPEIATPGLAATEVDPKLSSSSSGTVVDREVQYAMDKIYLAPQNQSPWNYLRGCLVKGGRKLSSVEEFVLEFVVNLKDGEDKEGDKEKEEDVKSTHALDLLTEIWAEKGQIDKADLGLRRLAERWDRIRVGYWEWRRSCLREGVAV